MKLNSKFFANTALVALLLLAACQGNQMNTPPGATGNVVSVAINSLGTWQPTPTAVDASSTSGTYPIVLVVLSTPAGGAPQDIHVTMVPAADSLASFNTATGNSYVMPGGPGTPAFTLVNNGVVTIPKGKTYGYLQIQTTPNDYFGSTPYAFAYRIASVQETGYIISAKNGYAVTPFVTKNKYDAEYSVTGTLVDNASPGINGACSYPMDVNLVTQNATTVWLYDKAIPGYYHTICSGGSLSYYGNAGLSITFDSNDNVVSVANIYVDVPSRNRQFQLDPSGVNKFDPVTKTLKIKYWLNQVGWTPRTVFDETYTFTGPR
ncbi:MAG: DUF1735 domain-containing protein [Bacteroidetes bacterium]|nr:DUF1735 domain-containing protein [Bacteroidota bacterium]